MMKIMLVARDPGGANTIIPLVAALQERNYELLLYGKDAALSRFMQFGLNGVDIGNLLPQIDIDSWAKLLAEVRPDFIITGTSVDDFSERYLWKAAQAVGIKSFAILDQWMNYGIRFSAYTYKEIARYELNPQHPYLPDRILVMDEEAKGQVARAGIAPDMVLVSGQPYFDLLMQEKGQFGPQQIQEFRRRIDFEPGLPLITYISEPLSQDYVRDEEGEAYWGYDEKTNCLSLLGIIAEIIEPTGQEINFVIKQHPRETAANYQEIIKRFRNSSIKIKLVREIDAWSLLRSSDLVCGMSSMLLLEAILLGCPVLSIQIGLKRANPLVLEHRGILASIVEEPKLKVVLQGILINHYIPTVAWQAEAGAIEKIMAYMEGLLCPS